MDISLPKLKAILLYFGNNTDTKYLGKVKLMKLFYFLDFLHVKRYGSPVTYDRYVHLEHGPIPQGIKNLIDTAADDLDNSLLTDTITFERPQGIDMVRMLPKRVFSNTDKNYLSETEMEILEFVCAKFGNKNTKYVEDLSHQEAPWLKTQSLEDIPYSLAAEDTDCQIAKEDIKLLEKII